MLVPRLVPSNRESTRSYAWERILSVQRSRVQSGWPELARALAVPTNENAARPDSGMAHAVLGKE
jgi:hypothetical protein